MFPPTSPWNTPINTLPVDARNATYMANMQSDAYVRLDLGLDVQDGYGMPFTVVPASQPGVPITFGTDGADYSDESDPGPYPLPLDAVIEGGTPAMPNPTSGDRHVLAIQQDTCMLYETYNTVRTADGFMCSSSAIWNLREDGRRTPGWTSADAAGLPIFPGLLRYEEIAAGEIRHALRFTLWRAQRAYVDPASHMGPQNNPIYPPYGMRVRLRADFPETGYSADTLVFIRALKTYGLIFADQGSSWYVTGTTDPRFATMIDEINSGPQRIRGSEFEVVQMGTLTCGYNPPGGCNP